MSDAFPFYVTGGTLRYDAPCYVERQADKDLHDGLFAGEFCYVLTSRQMGKSSLMVRTVFRLRQQGFAVAVLDLTALGQNLSIEQWYDGLIARLGQQLDIEDALLDFWAGNGHLGPLQRWVTALEKIVLPAFKTRIVIFVDEIDMVRSLPFSTDEFFAAIRACCNRRSQDPEFNRLAFCLLGVASPTDLIRETKMTPFNIGRRIELNDFNEREASPLAAGLSGDLLTGRALLSRVLFWTGGHPFLTQRLCRALYDLLHQPDTGDPVPPVIPSASTVDHLAATLFLSRQAQEKDDNLIFVRDRILRSDEDLASLLVLYREIRSGQIVPDNETNPLVSVLKLSGICRGIHGILRVRNRIYREVFDLDWVRTNMPGAEVRRQRKASRKGMARGVILTAILLTAYLVLSPFVRHRREVVRRNNLVNNLGVTYQKLQSYRADFELTTDEQVDGLRIPMNAAGNITLKRPNLISVNWRRDDPARGLEVKTVGNSNMLWTWLPKHNQFLTNPPSRFERPGPDQFPPGLDEHVGPAGIRPLYVLFLQEGAAEKFTQNTSDIRFLENRKVDRHDTYVFEWKTKPTPFLFPIGPRSPPYLSSALATVTAAIDRDSGLIRRLSVDLSPWASQIMPSKPGVTISQLVVTEVHRSIRINETIPDSAFDARPPRNARRVGAFSLSPPDGPTSSSYREKLARLIPPRLTVDMPGLLDLSKWYNAPLSERWHPGQNGNDLATLPTGILNLAGVPFDVRGIVQLTGRQLEAAGANTYPRDIKGIQIDQKCSQLHLLLATCWASPSGVKVARLVLHYADGETAEIPLVYGEDLRDWSASSDSSESLIRGKVAWSGRNAAKTPIRLFRNTHDNPRPDELISTIDCQSTMADAAPFIVGITLK